MLAFKRCAGASSGYDLSPMPYYLGQSALYFRVSVATVHTTNTKFYFSIIMNATLFLLGTKIGYGQ
jgi:hypothetical protein